MATFGSGDSSDAEQVQEFEQKYFQEIPKQLLAINRHEQNCLDHGVPVGMSQAKIGDKSVPIKDILLTSAAYSLPIFIAVSALITGPASLALAVKAEAAIGPATAKLHAAVTRYSPTELDVYSAVVSAMFRNHSRTLKGDGATLGEITEGFRIDKSLLEPDDLKAVLNDMASKEKKMLVWSVDGGVETFNPNKF
jgi:hypothetical protein